MIYNQKAARIVAVVVIAMLVITLAAALFGCSATKTTTRGGTDPESGLTLVSVADHYKTFRRIQAVGGTDG